MAVPTFIGIGAQRAATTWVYECLREHPEVYVPATKELEFFDQHFDRGLQWYEEQFQDCGNAKAVGEISPDYMVVKPAIERMAKVIPEVRLFAILREPVQRAFSAYQLFHERYKDINFADACHTSAYLKDRSMYALQLEHVYAHFPKEQVKIFLYDDVVTNPRQMLKELFEFIGVDDRFYPTCGDKVYNRIVFPNQQKMLKQMKLGWLVELVKKSGLGPMIKRLHKKQSGQGITENSNNRTKAIFRDDVLKLQQMLNRDLSSWL